MDNHKILNSKEVIDILNQILTKMGVDLKEEIKQEEDETGVWFIISTPDSNILIGTQGKGLSALNYLLRQLTKARPEDFFIIDVNYYYKQKIDGLKQKAIVIAERVKSFQTSIELEPMTPFERRCIHSFFTHHPQILTESTGSGSGRRVVLKYQLSEEGSNNPPESSGQEKISNQIESKY